MGLGLISRPPPPPGAGYCDSKGKGLLMFCVAACADMGVGVRGAMGAAIGCIDRDLRKSSKAIRLEFSERPRAHSAVEIEYWG